MKAFGFAILFAALVLAMVYLPSIAHAQNAAAGKEVYTKKCQTCHGADGSGNPGMAKALKVEFKHLGSAEVQKKSDAEIKKVITDGSGKMKPVTGVAGADLDSVVAYVRSLKK
jgi:mono/diheme cytochrome c family protein